MEKNGKLLGVIGDSMEEWERKWKLGLHIEGVI